VYTKGIIKPKTIMTKTFKIAICSLILLTPVFAVHAASYPLQKTFTGTVTKISGNQVTFKTNSAASYMADTGSASLVRRNGAAMRLEEIVVGDKVQVGGRLWQDGSMNASYIRNMSLYVHNGTFTGKIIAINPGNSLTIQSKTHGIQTIQTSPLTVYKKNGKTGTLGDVVYGITVTVKGTWERNNTTVVAKEVDAKIRLLNIDITGQLVMRSDAALTVLANGVAYGVDITKAQIKSKNNKIIKPSELTLSGQVRVQGKHLSESPSITATTVKDLTLVK
jgi:hypothetical protein